MKHFLLTVCLFVAVGAVAQTRYEVKGTAPAGVKQVYMVQPETGRTDSVAVSGGTFSFAGEVARPAFALLRAQGETVMPVYLDATPATVDWSSMAVKGSAVNAELSQWLAQFKPYFDMNKQFAREVAALKAAGGQQPDSVKQRVMMKGQLMADGLAIIAEAFSEEYGFEITPEAAAGMVSVTGEDSYTYTDWDPDTEYYVVAVGLDDKGRQTTDVQLSEPFRTLPLSAGSDTPMDCVIQVNGLTDEGISITVTPADKEMTYVGMVGEADFYALYESDDEYLTDDVAMWSEMAAAEGLGLAEIFDMFGLFLQGDQTFIFSSELDTINPGTLYLAYTYGLSEEGELTTGMQKVFFTVDENGDAHEAEAPAEM